MASLNKIYLMGNLTRDPELRHTPSGTAVCKIGLAVNRRFTTAQGEQRDETCYVDIEAWGRTAEQCNQYLRKGSSAFIEGRLRMDQWEDKATGQKRSRLLVHAENVQFIGGGARAGGAGEERQFSSPPADVGYAGGSQPAAYSRSQPAQSAMPPPPAFEPVEATDDDIPF
jgi:single-strand DNA-binding protein